MSADIRIFADLRDRDLQREGIMIAEGHLVAERLLEGPFEIMGSLCTPRDAAEWTARLLARHAPPPVILTESEISGITGFDFHRGVLVAARVPVLPAFSTWWQAFGVVTPIPALPSRLIVCPKLTDAENLGSIFRCAAALGWTAVGLGESCITPFSRRVLRVSMGNCLRVSSFRLDQTSNFDELKKAGFLVVGTSTRPDAMELTELRRELGELKNLSGPGDHIKLALVFGNEFSGLGPTQETACHRLATIPLHRGTDSLNVAVAAGIFMHELGPDRF